MHDNQNSNTRERNESAPLPQESHDGFEEWVDCDEGERMVSAIVNATLGAAKKHRTPIHCVEPMVVALIEKVIERVQPGLPRRRVRAFASGVREGLFNSQEPTPPVVRALQASSQ